MIHNLIVPTLNQYGKLQRMVNSIDYPVKHLLIIDNGGELRDITVPTCVSKVTVLSMPSNLGVAASWNLGIKLFSKDPYFVFGSDDIIFKPGALEMIDNISGVEHIWTTDQFPSWQLFGIGSSVVVKVGLFDEAIYPANFEDDDYERRCEYHNIVIDRVAVPHIHEAHSTVYANEDSIAKNSVTYESNRLYFQGKIDAEDFSAGGWDIVRRNTNSWD